MNLKKRLLTLTKKECKENGVILYLGPGKSVSYMKGLYVNGFFDFEADIPKLSCAIGHSNWELILVHELNHVRQWKENCKVWDDYVKKSKGIIDEAVSGKKISKEKLLIDAKLSLFLEHDCEKRSYKTLKQLGYPKEKLIEYIQKANAYALFYLYVAEHRVWYEIGKEPYNLKSVWGKFPKTFNINIDKTYARLSHLYDQCVILSD
jgi:hypothetical protein